MSSISGCQIRGTRFDNETHVAKLSAGTNVMIMLHKVSDFVFFLPFLFSLYHHPEPSETLYDTPFPSTMTHTPDHSSMTEYDVEWRSAFHEFLGLSIWLHSCTSIYYKLYGIKYKYRVVAVLYLQSCIHLFLDNHSLPLISCPVWALRSPLNHCPLHHWTLVFTASQFTHVE